MAESLGLSELVSKAQSGDREAWDQIVDRMNNLVWSVVRGFRFIEADAVDAAQMAWLRAIENLGSVRDPERLGLWLATITRRECLRLIERRNREVAVDTQDSEGYVVPDLQTDIARATVDLDEARRVVRALNLLSPDCQQLLRLVLADPAPSYDEISAALGIAVGTIGPRRARCLSRLRAACHEH